MKGSPLIATIIVILVLLGLYAGMRTLLLDKTPSTDSHAGHDHSGHSHSKSADTGHDDSSIETHCELFFSSPPSSFTLTDPVSQKQILSISEFDSNEWSGGINLSLEGHHIELQVDVTWADPAEVTFVEINFSPARHASKKATLRGDGNISDIAEFHW